MRHLNQLKKKFASKDGKKYRDDYAAFMNKVMKNGYAGKVNTDNPHKNETKLQSSKAEPGVKQKLWYIPLHGVYHTKKPNKIRIVFDCAAEYQKESLNKHLVQGPDLTNNLTGVLCRFRQEAFRQDITVRYHREISPCDIQDITV